MKRYFALFFCLCFLLPLVSCTRDDGTDDTRLRIVATSFPPYDFARAIAGENASLTMLIAPGTETHSYDPTPGDIRTVQKADIFLCGGGASDTWVEDLLTSVADEDLVVVRMIDVVTPLETEHEEGASDHAHEMAYDEHVWTSPENAARIVSAIAEALISADPAAKDIYRANADAYVSEILALSEDFRAVVTSGVRKTVIFADRFPFLYFAHAYGLQYDSAFPGCAEETEPGAQTVARLERRLRDEKIPVVFYTEFSNQKIADSLCEASGAKKLLFHSCHNVSRSDFDSGATYISLMRANLENLRKALN